MVLVPYLGHGMFRPVAAIVFFFPNQFSGRGLKLPKLRKPQKKRGAPLSEGRNNKSNITIFVANHLLVMITTPPPPPLTESTPPPSPETAKCTCSPSRKKNKNGDCYISGAGTDVHTQRIRCNYDRAVACDHQINVGLSSAWACG